jgi:hypothetical protein
MIDSIIFALACLIALGKMIAIAILTAIGSESCPIPGATPSTIDTSTFQIMLLALGAIMITTGILLRNYFSRSWKYGLAYVIISLLSMSMICMPFDYLERLQGTYIQIAMVLSSMAYFFVTGEQLTVMRKQLADNQTAMQLSKQPCLAAFPKASLVHLQGQADPEVALEVGIENCGDSPALNIQTKFFTLELGSQASFRHEFDTPILRTGGAAPSFGRKTLPFRISVTTNEMAYISKGEFALRIESEYLNVYGTSFKTCEAYFLDLKDRAGLTPNTTPDAEMLLQAKSILAQGKTYQLVFRRNPLAYSTSASVRSSFDT